MSDKRKTLSFFVPATAPLTYWMGTWGLKLGWGLASLWSLHGQGRLQQLYATVGMSPH